MRYETPVVAGGRYATADFEIGGEQIKAGDQLTVCWAAANLDDDGFDDPGRGRLRPRRQAPHRVRQRLPPLPGVAPRAAWSCRSSSARCTSASPTTRSIPSRRPGYNNIDDPHRRPAAAGVHAPLTAFEEREQHREVGVDVAAPEVVAGVGDHLQLRPTGAPRATAPRAPPPPARSCGRHGSPAPGTAARPAGPTAGPRGSRRTPGAPRAPTCARRSRCRGPCSAAAGRRTRRAGRRGGRSSRRRRARAPPAGYVNAYPSAVRAARARTRRRPGGRVRAASTTARRSPMWCSHV